MMTKSVSDDCGEDLLACFLFLMFSLLVVFKMYGGWDSFVAGACRLPGRPGG